MKPFKDHEATRRRHHEDPTRDSVHRSSLLVPEVPGAEVEITFLNHFLLKRRYPKVACRITAIDADGAKIHAGLHTITEPRVHRFPLSRMAEGAAASHLVEFFAADNLVVPFPAVMINHAGPGFLNTVHAYNRILNDVFEDDAINTIQNREASIDLESGTETFAVFMAGAEPCHGTLDLELATPGRVRTVAVALDVPRFCPRVISLADVFPDPADRASGVLGIRQPRQPMFYGRLLAGRRADGAFTANHSYYDSSSVLEYWDDAEESCRTYPLFADLDAVVRMYPIMSPGRISLRIEAQDADGRSVAGWDAGELESPGATFLESDVTRELAARGVASGDVAAFTLRARPLSGQAPTRINHQLLYGRGGLFASINVSLMHRAVFVPVAKTTFAWGQIPVGGGVHSWVGIVADNPAGESCDVELTLYDETGEIAQRRYHLAASGGVRLDAAELARDAIDGAPRCIWYVARASRPDLCVFTVLRHERTGHCSGEHSF